MNVRVATPADVEALARLADQSFRETFEDSNTAADMDAYCAEAFSHSTLSAELRDPTNTFFIAEGAGYAKMREQLALDCVSGPAPMELERIYVLARAQRQGVGRALLHAVEERARTLGYRTIWLGVWEHNHPALAFYARMGFRAVGNKAFQLGDDLQTDTVLERPL